MDIALFIRQRLEELEFEQKDLAAAVEVTDSYISQLLTRRKAPPAPERTDLYDKMGQFLQLPAGQLARMAEIQRLEQKKRTVLEPLQPLFRECREVVVRKCEPDRRAEVLRIFEKQPFGELERLVTQKLLDVTQTVVREQLRRKDWVSLMAKTRGVAVKELRVALLEFMDTEVSEVSIQKCASFLEPMIESWDIDLRTFSMTVLLNQRLAPWSMKRFEFVEAASESPEVEPGFEEFIHNPSLSGDATEEELAFLRALRFKGKRPSAIYYYRELQNLRDPLHFRPPES